MFRELRLPVALLLGVVTVGVAGYRTIEGWSWLESVWMAVITITTIGYGEIRPLSEHGRYFTLAYILGAVGAGGYAVATLTGYVVDGGLVRDLSDRRRRQSMSQLSNHFIVVGYGRLGREIAEDLRHDGARVVVVDNTAQHLEALPPGVLHVVGDGSSDAVLREAGIERARGVAIATPSSAVNVFITLSVRQLNERIYIITRVEDADAGPKAIRAGANAIVSPFASAGTRMAHRLLHPNAAEFVEQLFNREHRELVVDDVRLGPKLHGTLAGLRLRDTHGIGVIAVRRPDGELVTVPHSATSITQGDIVVVVGSEDAIRAFRAVAEG